MMLSFLSQDFVGDLLKLVKQKGVYLHKYIDNFEKFLEGKLSVNSLVL